MGFIDFLANYQAALYVLFTTKDLQPIEKDSVWGRIELTLSFEKKPYERIFDKYSNLSLYREYTVSVENTHKNGVRIYITKAEANVNSYIGAVGSFYSRLSTFT